MDDLVVGADVGGTSTRVGVATPTGAVLAVAVGGPGNPNSVGLAASAAQIRATTERALAGVPGRVASVVLGVAGGSRTVSEPGFLPAAMPDRVRVRPLLVPDLSVAFCSATAAPRGYVLVAGTGAVAGEVDGPDLVRQRDGWGWLLGDEGSGFWLGRAAVRATLEALQSGTEPGPLQREVLTAAGAVGYAELLQACYAAPPTWLAQFSVLVSRHAEHDPLAAAIAEEAVTRLWRLLESLEPGVGEPVVLGGSVLSREGPVSRGLRGRLAERLDGGGGRTAVLSSSDGVVGALWLALRALGVDAGSAHARLSRTCAARRGES